MKLVFWLSAFCILYTMIGYPIVLELLNKFLKVKVINANHNYRPTVSIIVPAHNEESVIAKKLDNLLNINYPADLLEIIVTSDNSTDKTNEIVKKYTEINCKKISLYEVKKRKGKTNAQDEAVKISKGEILIFTDANSMFDKNAVSELVSYLFDDNIGYVTGQLKYVNKSENSTSESEGSYWDIDLHMRQIESNLSSITAGNGSIYAIRKNEYININPVYSHDSIFPPKFVISGKRAVYNKRAIAYEKAGENNQDEFKRKVRMSRKIVAINFVDIKKYNLFKYGLFSFFYFSHRTLRNNLYFFHLLSLISNFILLFYASNLLSIYTLLFIVQITIYIIYFSKININNRYIKFVLYYIMTIYAQFIGAVNEISGKSRPFWEKAESTR